MKVVTKQEIKDMISSGELVKILMQDNEPVQNPPLSNSVNPVRMLYDFSPYIIKVDNHYVPAGYLFYEDTGEENTHFIHDKYASLPQIEFDENSGKYKITGDCADFGGYDVTGFTWYFDSVEDIIKEMKDE